jgi:hypothetical protein
MQEIRNQRVANEKTELNAASVVARDKTSETLRKEALSIQPDRRSGDRINREIEMASLTR